MKKDINFLEERDFGGLLSAPFEFLRQEFKPLIGALLKYAGPFLVVGMIGFYYFVFDFFYLASSLTLFSKLDMVLKPLGIFSFFFIIGFLVCVVVTTSYVSLYVKKGKGNFTNADIISLTKRKLLSSTGMVIILQIVIIVGMLLLYIPGIYILVASSFSFIILIHEDLSIIKAIIKSIKTINGKWFFSFGLYIVFALMLGILSSLLIIPAYLLSTYMLISGNIEFYLKVIIILSVFLYFAFYLLSNSLLQILLAFNYFCIKQEKEGGNLQERIAMINSDDFFKNENEDKIDKPVSEKEKQEDPDDDYNRFANPENYSRYADSDDDKPKF